MPKSRASYFFFLAVFYFLSPAWSAESKTCPEGQYFVRSHGRKSYVRADGTKVRATRVQSHCRQKTPGFDFLAPKIKEGIPPGWPYKIEKSKKWTDEERERLLEGMDEIPQGLWIDSIQGIYRMERSKSPGNTASTGDGIIVLYDSAFNSKKPISRILAHELSHEMYNQLPSKMTLDYRRSMGWRLKAEDDGSIVWDGRKSGYVEEDGALSPSEDFANNIEFFAFDREVLKKKTPRAYDWIKKHFDDNLKMKGERK